MNNRIKNDEILLAEVKKLSAASNPRAISLLYEHYFGRLVTFASSIVKTREAAEEVVEDVLIKLWSNKVHIDEISSLKVYLFSAVKNQAFNYLQKEARHASSDLLHAENTATDNSRPSPLEHLILTEMTQALQVAVESLPERCQIIFKLVREEGFKYKEVSEILNISVNTIDNQMAIAIRRICAALSIKKPDGIRKFR